MAILTILVAFLCSAYSAPGGWTSLTASSPEFGTGQTGTHRNHIRTPQSNRGRSTTGASIWMRPSPVLTPRFGAVRPLGKYRAAKHQRCAEHLCWQQPLHQEESREQDYG